MAHRLKIEGRGNLRDGYADTYTPEERSWLKEQHPDDYRILLHLEKEHAKQHPAEKATEATTATPATATAAPKPKAQAQAKPRKSRAKNANANANATANAEKEADKASSAEVVPATTAATVTEA